MRRGDVVLVKYCKSFFIASFIEEQNEQYVVAEGPGIPHSVWDKNAVMAIKDLSALELVIYGQG